MQVIYFCPETKETYYIDTELVVFENGNARFKSTEKNENGKPMRYEIPMSFVQAIRTND